MKLKNKYILSGMTMAMMLATTSCRDETFSDFWDDSDEFTVTLNVELEGLSPQTRGEREKHIGNGSEIDMLVYTVYYDNNKAQGKTAESPDWQAATQYEKKEDAEKLGFVPGHGQSVIDVSKSLQKGEPYPITLSLKKGQDYQVVFWAQSSKTDAFVIDDLKRVQMKYKNLDEEDTSDGKHIETVLSVNNDEKRDAFCRSISLSGEQANQDITVYLKRPLAQINVGTVGYDFETINRNADDNKKYLYSKIRINRAARFYNAIEDYTYTSTTEDPSFDNPKPSNTEAFYTIDYEYNKIPAYWNMDIPKYPSYTIYDADNFETLFPEKNKEESGLQEQKDFVDYYKDEEFLKVYLYERNSNATTDASVGGKVDYYPYASLGYGNENENQKTEIFKYLSMCYVLTATDDAKGESLTNVKVWLSNEAGDEVEVVNVNNVPVQRNHRTNIVGSLLTANATMEIVVDDDFAGKKFNDDANVESGEIADGFYYDAEKEEFQISNVNGLLFFQQLVNGNLTVREIDNTYNKDGVREGDPYPYYDLDHNLHFLKYKSHSKTDLGEKADLLLKAIKYKVDSRVKREGYKIVEDEGWPAMNNFSFYGCKVKLMADINLDGIEWIPIGFDLATWDYSVRSYQQPGRKINYGEIVDGKNINFKNRRVFAGTFDGNGHTIYNMTTKRFGVDVHESAFQTSETNASSVYPYDNVVWFPKGFFGLVGPGAEIKNLRLQNVEVYGCNGAAGIVGIVSSTGFPAKIQNCVVDQGKIIGEVMYRGDYNPNNYYRRNAARGVYIGGIVGQFNAKGNGTDETGVTGCEVRNVEIKGYRRVAGIIGGIADMEATNPTVKTNMVNKEIQANILVRDNRVLSSVILCDQFSPFNIFYNMLGNENDPNDSSHKVWMNGYGWGSYAQTALSHEFVGGILQDGFDIYLCNEGLQGKDASNYLTNISSQNKVDNTQFTVLQATAATEKYMGTARTTDIGNISLEYLPMLSSWFVDKVTLNYNYYGTPSTYTHRKYKDKTELWYDYGLNFKTPFARFPSELDMQFDEKSPRAGLYVESILLDGKGSDNGGRSVITPTGVSEDGACVMYIGARDRHQFVGSTQDDLKKLFLEDGHVPASTDYNWLQEAYKQPTTIKNVVLRGSPYAWAGIIISPNENMKELTLDNVTIYDVYKTLALDEDEDQGADWKAYTYNANVKVKPSDDADWIELIVKNSNLRGYTVPGEGWPEITYSNTTFEAGSQTRYSYDAMKDENGNPHKNRNEYKTCKIEAKTTFDRCYFKAPYYIDLSGYENSGITFNSCYGTSVYGNVRIKVDGEDGATKAAGGKTIQFIEIGKDVKEGKTVVKYYWGEGENDFVEL